MAESRNSNSTSGGSRRGSACYEEEPDVGVLVEEVDIAVEAGTAKAMLNKPAMDQILGKFPPDLKFGDVRPEQFEVMLAALRVVQEQLLETSKFSYAPIRHRFPNLVPYDWNALREHLGSWMGGGVGLTQWPIDTPTYMQLLRQVLSENRVGMIVALGTQEPKERQVMSSYWETMGRSFTTTEENGFSVHHVHGVEGCDDVTVLRYATWNDFAIPTGGQLEIFEKMFTLMADSIDNGKHVLVHCKGGVGRSGTFLMMYKAWRNEVTSENFYQKWIELRNFRMEVIQTQEQLNYVQRYVVNRDRRTRPKQLHPKETDGDRKLAARQQTDSLDQRPQKVSTSNSAASAASVTSATSMASTGSTGVNSSSKTVFSVEGGFRPGSLAEADRASGDDGGGHVRSRSGADSVKFTRTRSQLGVVQDQQKPKVCCIIS